MKILYTATLRAGNTFGPDQFLKIKLVAQDQVEAVSLAYTRAGKLQMDVVKVQELEPVRNEVATLLMSSGYENELRH